MEEQYRNKNDTEREWQLRKLFIEKFQNDFEHDRLLCLAQCYVNIQTMGCRYSDKIMTQIKTLTADFEPLLKARIESINNEMREKNAITTNKKPNNNYQNHNNNQQSQPKQQQQQQQSTTTTYANRQKLLGKTAFYDNQQSNVKSPNSKPIQILSRNNNNNNNKLNEPQTQLGAFSPQKNSSTPLSKKYSSSPNTSNLLGKSASGVGSSLTPSVPSGTTELAPAASQVPIPFGLSSASESAMPTFKSDQGRNALLNQLTKPADPLAILMSAGTQQATRSDDKFLKLNKINKLRDVLRNSNVQFDDNFELIDYFDELCRTNGINLTYVQYEQKDGGSYYGELFVETFRLVMETNKKRKKCKYACYKSAVQILKSKSELAVKLSTGEKRDPTYLKSNQSQQQQQQQQQLTNEVDFEYELYRTDSNSGMFVDSSNNVITNFLNSQPQAQAQQQQVPVLNENSLSSLNSMLKSLILPKEKIGAENASRNQSVLTSTQHDDSKETQQLDQDDDNDDDDDDENKSQTSDKKSRVKQNLVNFCLYIPCAFDTEINPSTLDKFVHDKNSINILHNSCIKSKCNLEFELKTKTINSSKPTKTIISGDRIQSESDDESSTDLKKLKCRCLINGMRISSVHAKNRADAKRQAALKAIKYLFKLFPAMKEANYHSLANNQSNHVNNSGNSDVLAKLFGSPSSGTCAAQAAPKYFKITKEELFSGLVPPSMFEQCSSLPSNASQAPLQQPLIPLNNFISIPSTHTQTNSQFGTN